MASSFEYTDRNVIRVLILKQEQKHEMNWYLLFLKIFL